MPGPDFFVVGAPKCATTAMHAYLRQHPQIFMPAQKELHYFGSDLSRLPSQLSPEAHDGLFVGSDGAVRVGETCIWALFSEHAAREIHAYNPASRIVVMLRNPLEMMHALHSEYLLHAVEDISDFSRAISAESDRAAGRRLPRNGIFPKQLYAYREIATFSVQLERYVKWFGRGQVHVVLYDDLKRDMAGEYRRLLKFLDVDPAFAPEFKVINPSKRLRSCALQRLLMTSCGLTQGWARRILPVSTDRAARLGRALAAWNLRVESRPPMSPRLYRRLQQEFRPEVERLGSLLERDLSHWVSRTSSREGASLSRPHFPAVRGLRRERVVSQRP